MNVRTGGPALSTAFTVEGLRALGVEAEVLSYGDGSPDDAPVAGDDFSHTVSPPAIRNRFAWWPSYKRFLVDHPGYDIYHIQGVWLYPGYITARLARRFGKPYLISPRGMLYPQDLAKGAVYKRLFLRLHLMRDLQRAACVHATCTEEMEHLRRLGVTSPVAVVPNPIDTLHLDEPVPVNDTLRVGYLGRVHRRKNIERLVYAWHALGDAVRDCELVVIGGGDDRYLDFLKDECERLQLKNVIFTGFLSGAAKDEAIRSLACLAVPSDFENFGNVVSEALVRGIPVIASKGTPWQELDEWGCGWWVDNDVPTLTATIRTALALPTAERMAMGMRGKELIRTNYTMEVVAARFKELYEWIAGAGPKPDFVYIK